MKPYTYDTTKARALLAEAGYPNGFKLKIVAEEAWSLEAQIIGKMLERVGLKTDLDISSTPDLWKKDYEPILDKPPEHQDWDIMVGLWMDHFGHTGATLLTFGFTQESDTRWMAYDPVYEEMWKDMARTLDPKAQEEKVRQLVAYLHERALSLFIYPPLDLYAVNKHVDFVPQKMRYLRLKETSVTDNHRSVRK